jgi:hypothetical protein
MLVTSSTRSSTLSTNASEGVVGNFFKSLILRLMQTVTAQLNGIGSGQHLPAALDLGVNCFSASRLMTR